MADMKDNLNAIMKEAQKMQERMQAAQKELSDLTVVGKAGAGLVTCEMNGRHNVKKVTINPNLMEEDVDMIEDLVAAAVNDAVKKIEDESRAKITDLTKNLKLPTDFNLPEED